MLSLADPYPIDQWTKRGSWEITANHPGTGYQVKFTVPFYDGMKPDFSDVRFSDNSTNALYYWKESYTESTSAVFIVKLASADTTGTLHYGNASATDASDGANTFELFDDAESGAFVDTWNHVAGTGTGEYSSAYAYAGLNSIYVNGTNNFYVSDNVYDNFILEANIKFTENIFYPNLCFRGSNTALTCYSVVNLNGSARIYEYTDGAPSQKAATTVTAPGTDWQKYTVKVNGSTIQLYLDDAYINQWTSATTLSAGRIGLKSSSSNANDLYVDNLRVRKYISTEPTVEYLEASANSPVADFSADVTTGTNPLTVTFSDLSTNTPTSWLWNFGDGSTSTVQNPVYEYLFPGTYKVILTATNDDGSDTETKIDYIEVTPAAGTIFIVREKIEMDHKVGTTTKHHFRVAASNGSGYKSTCTNPVILCSKNGADETDETTNWTISAFSATMNRFTLAVVDPGTWAVGDNIEIVIYCDEGAATLHLNVVSDTVEVDTSGLATSAELVSVANDVTAVKVVTDTLSLEAINAEVDTAISDAALPDAFLTAAIRSGRTVSQVLRIIEIMLDGSVTGLTSGSGSPVTFTGADGSTVVFTVDANGNRAISSVNLV